MVFINLKNELKTNDFFMVFMILSWFLGIFELFSNFSSGLLPMVFIKITFNIVPVLEPERMRNSSGHMVYHQNYEEFVFLLL